MLRDQGKKKSHANEEMLWTIHFKKYDKANFALQAQGNRLQQQFLKELSLGEVHSLGGEKLTKDFKDHSKGENCEVS